MSIEYLLILWLFALYTGQQTSRDAGGAGDFPASDTVPGGPTHRKCYPEASV